MRKIAILGLALAGSLSLFATEASAVVCAKGVYRVGCVGPNGGIVGHRSYYRGGLRSGTVIRHYGGPLRGRTVIRHY